MILYGRKDHAHVCSRNRFSLPTAYITVLQHERKPSTTGSVVMFLKFPLQPTNLYHDHKMQKLLLHVWCLMLECVSIVAGMIVVSGPSKLEFGDVLGQWLQGHLYVYISVTLCICNCVTLCVWGCVVFLREGERDLFYCMFPCLFYLLSTHASSTSCWNETLARWRWVSVHSTWCESQPMRGNSKNVSLGWTTFHVWDHMTSCDIMDGSTRT